MLLFRNKLCLFLVLLSLPLLTGAKTDIFKLIDSNHPNLNGWFSDSNVEPFINFQNTLKEYNDTSSKILYYRSYVYYLTIIHQTMYEGDKKQLENFIEEANTLLDELISREIYVSEAHILKAHILLYRISINRALGTIIKEKIDKHLQVAAQSDPRNPRATLVLALYKSYAPPLFGGNPEEAKNLFHQSIDQFKTHKKNEYNYINWGEELPYIWLGIDYAKKNNIKDAKNNYLKALEIVPNHSWIKNELLPQIENSRVPVEKKGMSFLVIIVIILIIGTVGFIAIKQKLKI